MNWLITGGCGYIGLKLISCIVNTQDKNSIRVIDNLSNGEKSDLFKLANFSEVNEASIGSYKYEFIEGDIVNSELALKIGADIDILVHLAANTGVSPSVTNPMLDCQLNVVGLLNYLESSRKNNIRKFIFASSGAPAGEVVPPIHEEIVPRPVSPYGASKLAGEAYCSAYYFSFGVDTIALRFSNVYGPGSKFKSSVIAKFMKAGLKQDTLKIYGDGNQTRDFIFIDDLINAIYQASLSKIGGEVFQVASGKETSVNEIINLISNLYEEYGLAKIKTEYTKKRIGDVDRNFSDISKIRNSLLWNPEVSLEKGLRITLNYFINEKKL